MEFRVLGPLEIALDDGEIAVVTGSRERAVLVRLALSANRVVAASQLISDIWGDAASDGAEHALQVHVSRLRKQLRPAGLDGIIETRPPGYVLRVDADRIDADRFDQLAADGDAALRSGEPHRASERFRAALALWRGPALADVREFPFAAAGAARLEERRLSVLETTLAAELTLGRHRDVAAELEASTSEHPLRERLWELRMLALYRCGRQAEAVRTYQDLRKLLAATLGLEPMPALRRLEQAILRQDPALEWSEDEGASAAVTATSRTVLTAGTEVAAPPTRYAASGDVRIAYQAVGEHGALDLVVVPGFVSNLDLYWESPAWVEMFERLSRSARVIVSDKRGTGLSDPTHTVPTLTQRGEDLIAVLDAVDSSRAVLFGISEGGAVSLHLAATQKARVAGVVLYGVTPRFVTGADWEWGWPRERAAHLPEYLEENWAENALLDVFAPSVSHDKAAQQAWNRSQRLGASPAMGRAVMEAMIATDCRGLLPTIAVPTLVLHRSGDRVAYLEAGRFVADQIADARFVELAGDNHLITAGEIEPIVQEIERFLASLDA